MFDHDGCDKFGGDQNTFDVDFLNAIPVLKRGFDRTPYTANACIDLHNVNTTKILHHAFDRSLHRLEIGNVSLISDGFRPERLNFLRDFLSRSQIKVEGGDRGARAGHGDGAGLADTDAGRARARTKDQGDASFEPLGANGQLRISEVVAHATWPRPTVMPPHTYST